MDPSSSAALPYFPTLLLPIKINLITTIIHPTTSMVQVQVPGTCLLCGLNTKFLSSHFAQSHSTHSFFPRGARCPCGHVASVLNLRTHQDATPLCRLKYRDDATPPPNPEIPPVSKVVVELPSPRTAEWRRQYSHANALLRKREREAIETVTARDLPPHKQQRGRQSHDFRTRDPTQYSRTAAYVLLDDTYGSQPKRTPSEASTYTPSGDERRRERHSTSSDSSGSESSAVDSDAGPKDHPSDDDYDFETGAHADIVAGAASDGPEVINLVDSSDDDGRRRPGLTPPIDSPQPTTSARPATSTQSKKCVDEYCGMCMKVYGTPKELYMHMNKVHERVHITEDDFTSKKLLACPCGRVSSLRGLAQHRELTCTLSEASRKRDAASGLEAKRRALYGTWGASVGSGKAAVPGDRGGSGKVYRNANGNKRYPGTCNICDIRLDDLYWHMRAHNQEGRHLVPSDITAEDLEICRCGKTRGLTLMARVMHDKWCPYGKNRTVTPVSEQRTAAPRQQSTAAPRQQNITAPETAPLKHVGKCNICKREVTDIYQHLRNHADRRLKPKHITCETMVICRCGRPKAKTEVARIMHKARGCPYDDDDSSSGPGTKNAAPPPTSALTSVLAPSVPIKPGVYHNRKYPGTCNICRKFCNDLYMHMRTHKRRLKPGDITCDSLVICRCGKTKGLTTMAISSHNKYCKYAGLEDPPAPVPGASTLGRVPVPNPTPAPPADDGSRGGRCNLCRVTVKWLYNHVMDVHPRQLLRPQDISASTWTVCKCGKMHGVTEGAFRKHAFSCQYAGQSAAPAAPETLHPDKRPRESIAGSEDEDDTRGRKRRAYSENNGAAGPTRVHDPDVSPPPAGDAAIHGSDSNARLRDKREASTASIHSLEAFALGVDMDSEEYDVFTSGHPRRSHSRRRVHLDDNDGHDTDFEGDNDALPFPISAVKPRRSKRRQTARKSSVRRHWDSDEPMPASPRVQLGAVSKARDTPVPEQVSPRKRVATTPVFSIADSEESAPRSSEKDAAPGIVPAPAASAAPAKKLIDNRRRSAPQWAAHNSPEAEEDEAEHILTTKSTPETAPRPPKKARIEVRLSSSKTLSSVKPAGVTARVDSSSQSSRQRLSGIDVPPRPAKKKRPRHSVPA